MRRISNFVPLIVGLALMLGPSAAAQALASAAHSSASAVSSGFTYQGKLTGSSGPVNAVCNFQFKLWNDALSGAQVGGVDTESGLTVTAGLFTAVLNTSGQFGAQAFTGEARWLGIAVQCPGDVGFVLLSPRQLLTAAPYALSLAPGAVISGTTSPVLSVINSGGGYAANLEGNTRLAGNLLKVYAGTPQSALPVAFGRISLTTTVSAATANVSSVITNSSPYLHYEITITGETYDIITYVTLVTPGIGCYGAPKTTATSGKLWVVFENDSAVKFNCNFSFVIYKP